MYGSLVVFERDTKYKNTYVYIKKIYRKKNRIEKLIQVSFSAANIVLIPSWPG